MKPSVSSDSSGQIALWGPLALVLAATIALHFYGLSSWPWDHDEVPSLVELGLVHLPEGTGPASQFIRLPKLVPVWYGVQGLLLNYVPMNEGGTRLLAASCGILAVAFGFIFAARHWGLAYAFALAVLLNGAQCLVWLSQQNRFYTMALLFFVLTVAAIWSRKSGIMMWLVTAVLAGLTVLSHNLFMVVFVLAFAAACGASMLGHVRLSVLVRSGIAAFIGVTLYLFYLRPIMQDWTSGDTGGTHSLVSFAAQAGIPTITLALFGTVACLLSSDIRRGWSWWILLFGFNLAFVGVSSWILKAWNPRYAVLFMPPMWVLAAYGMETIGRRLRSKLLVLCWYGCVALLLLPKLASHYQDGSRHDFRAAAQFLSKMGDSERPLLCNWPETLFYYLPEHLRPCVRTWWTSCPVPAADCYIVYGSNQWEPILRLEDRPVELVEEIARRRFDEQSHVIRIYRVGTLRGVSHVGDGHPSLAGRAQMPPN
jgi:hypothetical protein